MVVVVVVAVVAVVVVGDAPACLRAISACRLVFFGAGDEGFRNVPEEEANFSNMDVKLDDVERPFSLVFTTLLTLSRVIRTQRSLDMTTDREACYITAQDLGIPEMC